MNRHKLHWWLALPALALIGPLALPVSAQEAPAYSDPEGLQVLNRGPIHEAFAEPVIYDPKPSPVIVQPPPDPIEELPPDQRPEGDNVQWVPGYWAWDDTRSDYVWLSGIWRDVPPGRQWVPGYWNQVEGGYQWTPGAWVSTEQSEVQYLPAPPESLEVGPSSPATSADATWSPGYWSWQDTRYVWRPGFWVPFQQDWAWVPAHYVWSPSGYLFVNGYWDRPLLRRGQAFAPVYFSQPLYRQPNFRYTPSIGLVTSALASSLFVRPAYQQYYFGDYYASRNFQSGIYPWYSFHQSRYGYDPLFSHYAAVNTRRDPRWVNNLHDEYRYRRDHPEARPPQTFARQQSIVNDINNINTNITNTTQQINNNTRVQNLIMARPLGQIAARGGSGDAAALRFERLDDARRQTVASQAAQLQRFRQERLKQERESTRRLQANQANQAKVQPGRFDLRRSPVTAALPGGAGAGNQGPRGQRNAPPPLPTQPRADLNARPPVASQARPGRHDPDPDQLPPHFRRNQAEGARPGQPGIERREVLRPPLQKKAQESRKAQPPPAAKSAIEKRQAPRPELPKRSEIVRPPGASQVPPARPGAQPGRPGAQQDRLPPQVRRDQADDGRPGQPGLERREVLRPPLQQRADQLRGVQPRADGLPGVQPRANQLPGVQPRANGLPGVQQNVQQIPPAAKSAIEKRQAPRAGQPRRPEPRKDQRPDE